MKVLVTGGGGFLGSAIVRRLVERGDRVRSLSRGHYPALDALGAQSATDARRTFPELAIIDTLAADLDDGFMIG